MVKEHVLLETPFPVNLDYDPLAGLAASLVCIGLDAKIRDLKKKLRQAGFSERAGKGSHTNWSHPLYQGRITLAGKDGDDTKRYQEKEVERALQEVKQKQQNG